MKQLKEPKIREYNGNFAEKLFAKIARSKGWEVTKRGYPDFICYKGDMLMLVEVKPQKNYRLKISQFRLMNKLSKYGVKCYKWSPDNDWISK